MRMQKTQKNTMSRQTQPVLKWLLWLALTPMASTVFADGFGVNDNVSTAKINALLQNVQSQGQVGAEQPKAQAVKAERNPAEKDLVGDSAFASTVRDMLPLTPDQIKTLHYLFDQTQQAAAQSPTVPPKPTSSSVIVNLSPGATPPVVRLQRGYVSSLVFVDATGGSWPIQAYDIGDTKNFNVQWDQKGNTLMVQALSSYDGGNMAIMLKGLDTPIMVTLMPGQRAVDYRVDFRIPKVGPNPNEVLEGLPGVENPQLINVLDGVPPEGAEALKIRGSDEEAQAWLVNGNLFFRTRMTILSPAFISTMQSADGTHAYQLPATPILLAMSRGKTIKLTIEGL